MKAGWMYPHRDKCGIAHYSRDYIEHLKKVIQIIDLNPDDFTRNRQSFIKNANTCDLIHVQYDTTTYFRGRHDFYHDLMKSIEVPTLVTVHDLYKDPPGVFPRSGITGPLPFKRIKEILYDMRHPWQTAFERHRQNRFYTKNIHLHHTFQKKFLGDISGITVHIKPHPLKLSARIPPTDKKGRELTLGAFGFINPLFNYTVLFETLKQLEQPWRFIWVGGLRSPEQQPLLACLKEQINTLKWNNRFFITGWVPERQLDIRLSAVDMMLALFTQRSSSGSIARALGIGLPVLASRIPLTEELISFNTSRNIPAPLLLCDPDPSQLSEYINNYFSHKNVRTDLRKGINFYRAACSYAKLTQELINLYREITAS